MTAPGPAARHDGAGDRSPFNGSDVCAAAALPLVPGGRTVMFDQDVWDFGDVPGLAAYLDLRDSRLATSPPSPTGGGGWSPRSTSTPAWRPPTRSWRCCPAPAGSR